MTDITAADRGAAPPTPAAPPRAFLHPSVRLDTWPMWLVVLLPVFELALITAMFGVAHGLALSGLPGGYDVAVVLVSEGATWAVVAVLWAVGILLAWADHRMLVRRGVPQPMRWGWGALGLVYLIGRGVVLRRRVGRGAALTWIGLAVVILVRIVTESGAFERLLLAVVQ